MTTSKTHEAGTPELPLTGRRAVVTGAATGVGAAAVEAYTDAGATVVALYHSTPPPERLQGRAEWLRCDVRDRDAVSDAFAKAVATLGGVDVLLHAAGTWRPATPGTLTDEELDSLVDTNFKATVVTNQAAFAVMREHGGRIINLGSSEAVRGNPGAPLYAATKAAVQAWTRSAASAWGKYRITVNAIAPAVDTPGAERLRQHLGPERAAQLAQRHKVTIPIGGALGDPVQDLGPVMVFLAGAGSQFVTGQLIAVDGGLIMLGA
jgi:NAD(P)-dependent dehydrogenase (short-subunit alcohol dehydrogenase family)